MTTEKRKPHDVRHGDVLQDPRSGRWITVTRIVNGSVEVSGKAGTERTHSSAETLTFYGDGRLDEEVTVAADAVVNVRI
jgi:hypothetical protein